MSKPISINQIIEQLPMNSEPNSESFALRLLFDQNRVDDAIRVELLENHCLTLRATFHATSNPFMQARIFLTRRLVPLTVGDALTFNRMISNLAQQGRRKVMVNDACAKLFAKYQIDIKTEPTPTTKSRLPRS